MESIYRGFTIYQSEDKLWRWTDTHGVAACQDTFESEDAAMNDVDRYKRERAQAKKQ